MGQTPLPTGDCCAAGAAIRGYERVCPLNCRLRLPLPWDRVSSQFAMNSAIRVSPLSSSSIDVAYEIRMWSFVPNASPGTTATCAFSSSFTEKSIAVPNPARKRRRDIRIRVKRAARLGTTHAGNRPQPIDDEPSPFRIFAKHLPHGILRTGDGLQRGLLRNRHWIRSRMTLQFLYRADDFPGTEHVSDSPARHRVCFRQRSGNHHIASEFRMRCDGEWPAARRRGTSNSIHPRESRYRSSCKARRYERTRRHQSRRRSGLFGEFTMSIRVFGVIAPSSIFAVRRNPSSSRV